jgi:putative transposase
VHNKALGQYFFCIPVDIESKPTSDIQGRVCAIDPGIRTMATVYDVSGRHGCTYWGCGPSFLRFLWISRKISRIQSRVDSSSTRHHSRRNMRKLMARLRSRLKYLADEMHHLFAHWLCRNFETILLPEFRTKRMAKRGARVIGKKSVKVLSSWSHYRFKQFLQHKAREYSTNVIICDEHWTSKTCGNCGNIRRPGRRQEVRVHDV